MRASVSGSSRGPRDAAARMKSACQAGGSRFSKCYKEYGMGTDGNGFGRACEFLHPPSDDVYMQWPRRSYDCRKCIDSKACGPFSLQGRVS